MKIILNDVIFDVDKEDILLLIPFNWYVNQAGYVETCISGKAFSVHRIILGNNIPKGMVVDHINGNKLDNRKCNLRICTARQNSYNRGKPRGKYSSKYKGVSWNRYSSFWWTAIQFRGKAMFLYRSLVEVECAYAYNVAASILMRDFAKLNDIDYENEGIRQIVIDKLMFKFKVI